MATLSLVSTAASPSFRHIDLFPPRPPLPASRTIRRLITRASSTTGTTTPATSAVQLPGQPRYGGSCYHPSLEVIGGGLESFIPAFKSLHRPYDPFPLIGWNGHVETIFAALFRSLPAVKYKRECLRMSDNGVVALDWISGDLQSLPPDSPILVLLPGLAGGSSDRYVKHMVVKARSRGWRVIVFNSRGCANSPVVTPKFYSAAYTEDLREVVAHLTARFPKANIYAAGWSLGANILVRYIGQDGQACPLAGAVSLCNPFNVVIADDEFCKGINFIYDRSLAVALRKIFRKHALLFEDLEGNYKIPMTANCQSVREFHDGLTVATFGYKSVDDYYSKSNSSDYINDVRVPLLCIQAANDPIAPNRAIPRKAIQENPNCILVVTPTGGHLGWVAGSDAPRGGPWTDPIVMDFLQHLEQQNERSPDSLLHAENATIPVLSSY